MHLSVIIFSFLAPVASASTVYLIRHGEKPSDGGSGLNAQGVQRAQCLRNVFGASSGYNIGYIIVKQPKASGKRERPLETVQPLASDLGLTVDTSCDRDDSDCVANLVDNYDREETGQNILICWEHGQLTDIAEAFGDSDAPKYPNDSFNTIWTDPEPYNAITSMTSENCPGLDN